MRNKTDRLLLFDKIDIYPVISSEFCNGKSPLRVLEELGRGGARIVQLREKNMSNMERYELAWKFRKLCNEFNMLLIINDHIDIALAVNADGVHLGQDDLPLKAAHKIAPELIIGVSTHSKEEAMTAQENLADYINIGPIFPTKTKANVSPALGTEILKTISGKLEIPFTVMGGIKEKHIPVLLSLGARKIAMVTEITMAEDITGRVLMLREYFD